VKYPGRREINSITVNLGMEWGQIKGRMRMNPSLPWLSFHSYQQPFQSHISFNYLHVHMLDLCLCSSRPSLHTPLLPSDLERWTLWIKSMGSLVLQLLVRLANGSIQKNQREELQSQAPVPTLTLQVYLGLTEILTRSLPLSRWPAGFLDLSSSFPPWSWE
jgi:hypothetical protein